MLSPILAWAELRVRDHGFRPVNACHGARPSFSEARLKLFLSGNAGRGVVVVVESLSNGEPEEAERGRSDSRQTEKGRLVIHALDQNATDLCTKGRSTFYHGGEGAGEIETARHLRSRNWAAYALRTLALTIKRSAPHTSILRLAVTSTADYAVFVVGHADPRLLSREAICNPAANRTVAELLQTARNWIVSGGKRTADAFGLLSIICVEVCATPRACVSL